MRLAILSPRECAKDIWKHLNELNKHHATTLKQDKVFLPEYIGFHDVFKCGLDIPNGDDTKRFMGYSLSEAIKTSAQEFFNGICQYIDVMEREKHEFDVLVIYIPNQLNILYIRSSKSSISTTADCSLSLHAFSINFCARSLSLLSLVLHQ